VRSKSLGVRMVGSWSGGASTGRYDTPVHQAVKVSFAVLRRRVLAVVGPSHVSACIAVFQGFEFRASRDDLSPGCATVTLAKMPHD
jgi:hypothetical protein